MSKNLNQVITEILTSIRRSISANIDYDHEITVKYDCSDLSMDYNDFMKLIRARLLLEFETEDYLCNCCGEHYLKPVLFVVRNILYIRVEQHTFDGSGWWED